MSDVIELPRYRYRGSVAPSAEVSRPAAVTRNAAASGAAQTGTSATLDIFDVIDSWGGWSGISAAEVDAALKAIGEVETLFVRLNSPGGEASEGVAIANLLRAHPANVRVTVYGLAASAASYIAIAGDTVSMGPGSLMFVHDAINIVLGDAADLRKVADTLDTLSDSIASLYVLKAGGTLEQWRAAMHADTWYGAEAAVTAKLADRVGLDPQLPADLPPVEDDAEDEDGTVIEIDIEISPAARAAARRFDLSMLPNAPAALAPKTPAEPPETQDPHNEEAVTMTPDEIKALRERLGLAVDADASAINAKLDELEDQATKPETPPEKIDPAAAKAAVEADGKVVVSQSYIDALDARVKAGEQALARQDREDRDGAIKAAQDAGKIGRDEKTVASWHRDWQRDSDATKAELEKLPARFPVAAAPGVPGGGDGASVQAFTDDEAGALAQLAGVSKEGLLA